MSNLYSSKSCASRGAGSNLLASQPSYYLWSPGYMVEGKQSPHLRSLPQMYREAVKTGSVLNPCAMNTPLPEVVYYPQSVANPSASPMVFASVPPPPLSFSQSTQVCSAPLLLK
jgi:hypothetical protein